jgi:gentisate 1,2-dioxygenase
MNDSSKDAGRPDRALVEALEASRYHPLWTRYKSITPMRPVSRDEPMLWRWREFEPFVERAATEVPIEDVERRAIIMTHPAFGGATQTTSNLLAAFTVLEPGDHAVPHRHTAAAIRFATRSEGAVTIVNGRRCEMHEGDLVLTPPMCWHGHINEGHERTVWFDAANMPLICGLDANFFEPGTRSDEAFWQVDEGDERLYAASGLQLARDDAPATMAHSPKFRYPGEVTRRLLDAMPRAADGQRSLRYTNPETGGPVMPTLDCQYTRLVAGAATRARRATHNAICLVVSGEGESRVGDQTIAWQQHDVFTIPHWTFASHTARTPEADLFIVSDRPVYDALGLLRIETE